MELNVDMDALREESIAAEKQWSETAVPLLAKLGFPGLDTPEAVEEAQAKSEARIADLEERLR